MSRVTKHPKWAKGNKMKEKNYKIWECKIVVPEDAKLPRGFDAPPRQAVKNAIYDAGIDIVACFSGWDGELTKPEREVIETKNIT